MRRTLIPLAAAVLTSVLAVGTLAPAASAAPDRERGGKATSQVDKRLSSEQRKVVSLATSKDSALARTLRTLTRDPLVVGQTEVLTNITADRALLDTLKAAAVSGTTVEDVRAVGTQVRAVRPDVYPVVLNGLRQATRVQTLVPANDATISELAGQADAKELDGFDVTQVLGLLAGAGNANGEALVLAGQVIARGVVLTATSGIAARNAFSADVAASDERLDTVEAQLLLATEALAAMVPVVEEPAA